MAYLTSSLGTFSVYYGSAVPKLDETPDVGQVSSLVPTTFSLSEEDVSTFPARVSEYLTEKLNFPQPRSPRTPVEVGEVGASVPSRVNVSEPPLIEFDVVGGSVSPQYVYLSDIDRVIDFIESRGCVPISYISKSLDIPDDVVRLIVSSLGDVVVRSGYVICGVTSVTNMLRKLRSRYKE